MLKTLLLTPPMTQLNTPYPATAYLTGFLRKHQYNVAQADPAIELVCRLFSKTGLLRIREHLETGPRKISKSVAFFLKNFDSYLGTVEPAIRFLQGRDPSVAARIASRRFLPEGPRFAQLEQLKTAFGAASVEESLAWAFGNFGVQDMAKYFASLFIDDLADVVREGVDERFLLSRYAEKLAASQAQFDPIATALAAAPSLIDIILDEITDELLAAHEPNVIGITVPFPGNVYAAFRIAKRVRETRPSIKIILGGGYVNTELRKLSEPRVFDYFDAVTLDDGERPFLCLLEYFEGRRSKQDLLRTFVRDTQHVQFISSPKEHDIPFKDSGTPSYDGLPLEKYISVVEMLNPMHRLWSDARWNKVTLSHGCYWKKCSFCDVSLDYIGRYEPAAADITLERMQTIAHQTGQTGFHFVDEAAPPALLKNLSERIVEQKLSFSWWGNLRFENTFTPELAQLMAKAGCIAVTGGLEVASNRLLKLMNKGVSVEQVARVTRAFNEAGILVHAYLMYGFPTQTLQESVDSLEYVRQLFAEGCLDSAYWHRFSATIHSPIGKDPKAFGIELRTSLTPPPFAQNDLEFYDPTECDHDRVGVALKKALYNFMHGVGLDADVRDWFDFEVPKTTVPTQFVKRALRTKHSAQAPC